MEPEDHWAEYVLRESWDEIAWELLWLLWIAGIFCSTKKETDDDGQENSKNVVHDL